MTAELETKLHCIDQELKAEIIKMVQRACICYAEGIVPEENIRNSRGSEEIAENYLRKAYDHGRQEERTAIVQNMFAKIQEDTIPTS